MIEQAMYLALGFVVAGLLALLLLPAFWRRAMRLSMRRLRMLAPMSAEEVVAERDLLRADFAVRERRLEQEVVAVKAARAHDLVDIGRHAERIADLEGRLKRAEAYGRDVELQLREAHKSIAERTELLSSTEQALHEMTERAERGVERLRLLESDKETLGRESEARQGRVDAHEAKIAKLHEQNEIARREIEQLNEALKRASRDAERLPAVEADLRQAAADRNAARGLQRSLETMLEETRARLEEFERRRREDAAQAEGNLRAAQTESKDLAGRLETARADNAMLQGAMEALRKEHTRLREAEQSAVSGEAASSADWAAAIAGARADGEAGALDPSDVKALREAIADMGARVAELSGAPRDAAQ